MSTSLLYHGFGVRGYQHLSTRYEGGRGDLHDSPIFGWTKTVGNFSKTRYLGQAKTQMAAYFVGAAYNLLRIAKLTEVPG